MSALPDEFEVSHGLRRTKLHALVPIGKPLHPGEQRFALPQQQGRLDELQLVDQPGVQVLPDGRGSAADSDILAPGGGEGLMER